MTNNIMYLCQECSNKYHSNISGDWLIVSFCSRKCHDLYVKKHNRLPAVCAEIPLDNQMICNIGRDNDHNK